MSKLVRIGNAAFALDKVAAVEGDRVVFTDGKEIRVSKKSAEGLLSEIMAPTPAVPHVPGPFPTEAWYEALMAALLDLDRALALAHEKLTEVHRAFEKSIDPAPKAESVAERR